jgi:UDP-N-acetylmuramoyl-tripeptide--D-alanyl-D-alanine ligase
MSEHLWRSQDLVAAMSGRPVGTLPEGISGISIDSRSLMPGEAFFAIKGDLHDGHDFATAAVKAGAGLLVVAEGKLPALGRITTPLIVVDDVLAALIRLSQAARARSKAKIIAVTGSAGKTTTKEELRHTLSAVGKVHASDKSFNNHWGVPLSLARLPEDAQYAIFEIGMNHADEIRPLVKLVRPHVAIITLIAAAHLGHFRGLDDIARAKAEIFEGLDRNGHALINRDDARYKLLEKLAKEAGVKHIHGFGENAKAEFRLLKYTPSADHSVISAAIGKSEVVARIGVPGRHIAQNTLAVLGAAKLVGAEVARVAVALGDLQAEGGRGRRYQLAKGITLIDESYNANTASMQAAIDLLDQTPVAEKGRRIAVLGDMRELGAHSAKLHASLSAMIEPTKIDLVFLGGPEMSALAAVLPPERLAKHLPDVEVLKPVLLAAIKPGDTIMVKSSNGVGFSKLVTAIRDKFPADAESTADA